MLKRFRSRLTLRIFLLTFGFTMLACAVTYLAIAGLTPLSYTSLLENELDQQAAALIERLEQRPAGECRDILQDFSRESNAEMRLTDSEGVVWYDTLSLSVGDEAAEAHAETTFESGDAEDEENIAFFVSEGLSNATVIDQVIVAESHELNVYQQNYIVQFADGLQAELIILGGMRAVNQAAEAMKKLMPLLIAMALALSLLGAAIHSRFITRPIVDLSRIAGRMAAQDFSAQWTRRRDDEIGVLGDSLNLLSRNLSGALVQLKAANAALQRDIDRERELERQRTAFFAAASHELKTPVTILKGQLSGMLAQVGVYRDREKYLARALEVSGRMESLIREILTISRIESEDFAMQAAPVNLSRLMEKQLALNEELIGQKEMRVEADLMPDVLVQGNEQLLANALDNVLTNAVLYSPPGATIRVAVGKDFYSVENTRASIPEESLDRLFQPFYRVEQSRSRNTGGSGLGLYLVRTIMGLHGAVCRVENTAEGVRFSARFRTAGGGVPHVPG